LILLIADVVISIVELQLISEQYRDLKGKAAFLTSRSTRLRSISSAAARLTASLPAMIS